MTAFEDFSRTELLFEAAYSDSIAPKETAELEELLAGDLAARQAYEDFIQMNVELHFRARAEKAFFGPGSWKGTRDSSSDSVPDQQFADEAILGNSLGHAPPRSKSLLNWASRHPRGPAIAIAATVLIGALVVMGLVPAKEWMADGGKARTEERDTHPKPEYVAKLSNWQDDVWFEDTRPPLDDPRLEAGRRLILESGLAEITYGNGVVVILQGPAEYEVQKGSRGRLELGKLTARAPVFEGKGFVIETPTAQVEDIGTEFGVVVYENKNAEVHVFEGKVRARSGTAGAWHEATVSQSLFVNASGKISRREDVARDRFLDASYFKNLIVNGGFEASGTNESIRRITGGIEGVAGWMQLPDGGDHLRGDGATFGFQPHRGRYCYHLGSGFGRGGIYQNVETEVGETYEITFAAAGFPTGKSEQVGRLSAGDLTTEFKARRGQSVVSDMGWTSQGFRFKATDQTTRIQFENLPAGPGENAISIDEVYLRRSRPELDGSSNTPEIRNQEQSE